MVVRIVTIVLLLCVGACQSAAVRHNTLPEKFLGTWHGYAEPYGYRFHADGRFEVFHVNNGFVVSDGEYKVLYADNSNVYYIIVREISHDLYRIEPDVTVYGYIRLIYDTDKILKKPLIMISHAGMVWKFPNESWWSMQPISWHTNYVQTEVIDPHGKNLNGFDNLLYYSKAD